MMSNEILNKIITHRNAILHLECAMFAEQLAREPEYANAAPLLSAAAKLFREYAEREGIKVYKNG